MNVNSSGANGSRAGPRRTLRRTGAVPDVGTQRHRIGTPPSRRRQRSAPPSSGGSDRYEPEHRRSGQVIADPVATAPLEQIVKYIFDEVNIHFKRVYRDMQVLKEDIDATETMVMENGAGQALLSGGIEKCAATIRLHEAALQNVPGYMEGHTAELLKVRAELAQSQKVTEEFAKHTVTQVDAINLRLETANLEALGEKIKTIEEAMDHLSVRVDQGMETLGQQHADL